jgi:hypothetical protein
MMSVVFGSMLLIDARADEFDELQSCVRGAGDVDGDGTPDLMIADRAKSGGPVWIVSGKTRERLLALSPRVACESIAGTMDRLGDINGDGASDLVVCWRPPTAPIVLDPAGKPAGHACIYSGRDGSVLFEFRETWTAASGGDINGDGTPDVLLGASQLWRMMKPGRVQARSGRDGAVLLEVLDAAPTSEDPGKLGADWPNLFATSLAGLGDVDGDGRGDFVVGAPGTGGSAGTVELRSGRDGHAIARVSGSSEKPDSLGSSLAPVGDVDGDGACDVLVGAIHRYATICSGRDLRRLQTVTSRGGYVVADAFASSVDRLGDIDGDGIGDWIVGANESLGDAMFDEGYAQIYSGKDGKLLRVDFESKQLGVDVCGLGDINGDGVPDEAIACPSKSWVKLHSGKDGKLIHELDVAKLREPTPKPR